MIYIWMLISSEQLNFGVTSYNSECLDSKKKDKKSDRKAESKSKSKKSNKDLEEVINNDIGSELIQDKLEPPHAKKTVSWIDEVKPK